MAGEAAARLEALIAKMPSIIARTCAETAQETQMEIDMLYRKNADSKVYSHGASAWAESKRRYELGWVTPEMDSTDISIIYRADLYVPLQHPVSKDGSKHYDANTILVVETGAGNYNQKEARPYRPTVQELKGIAEDKMRESLRRNIRSAL